MSSTGIAFLLFRQAQIGVAMGSANASDVAREAGDIVLMDDQFSSIVMAIEEVWATLTPC